jgi:nucleoid-associated protein EbfC
MFQNLGNLASLWKQAGQLSGQLEKLGEELRKRHTTGTSGGGMVEVEINGALEVLHCKLDPQLVAQGDRELLEDLLVGAVNQAISKAKQLHAEALKDLTGGLQLPGIREALEKISGMGPEEYTSDAH